MDKAIGGFIQSSISRRHFLKVATATIAGFPIIEQGLHVIRPSYAFPPDPFFKNVARMVYHENPWGPHPSAVEAIRAVLGKGRSGGGVNQFDDPLQEDLKMAILQYNGLDDVLTPENVILGVGSSEVLFMAADTFTSPEHPLITEWITYHIIIQRSEQNNAVVTKIPLRSDWRSDLAAMEEEIQRAQGHGTPYGLVHCNVINNPAGTFLHEDTFDSFARSVYQKSPETIILCDDSDQEFMDADKRAMVFQAARHVREGKNMLHVQTFSHIFGLTGLRVGYGIARKDLIERMKAHKIFAGVNVLGNAAAVASLAHAGEQIARCNEACVVSRNWLYHELDAMGLQYLPSQGHYILINLEHLDGTVAILRLYLFHKVFVRWCSGWGLDNWIRVNPGTEWENERFIAGLRSVLAKSLNGVSLSRYLSTTEGCTVARAAVKMGFPLQALQKTVRGLRVKKPQVYNSSQRC
jgi:histidinol-phosphate aminotransferase